MIRKRYAEERIALALRQHEAGPDIFRKLGIAEQTIYRWNKKYGGMGVAELRRLRQLEEENRKRRTRSSNLAKASSFASTNATIRSAC